MRLGCLENYVEPSVFEAIGEPDDGVQGEDWTEAFTPDELDQQQNELRSVVHAQQQAMIATEYVISSVQTPPFGFDPRH